MPEPLEKLEGARGDEPLLHVGGAHDQIERRPRQAVRDAVRRRELQHPERREARGQRPRRVEALDGAEHAPVGLHAAAGEGEQHALVTVPLPEGQVGIEEPGGPEGAAELPGQRIERLRLDDFQAEHGRRGGIPELPAVFQPDLRDPRIGFEPAADQGQLGSRRIHVERRAPGVEEPQPRAVFPDPPGGHPSGHGVDVKKPRLKRHLSFLDRTAADTIR